MALCYTISRREDHLCHLELSNIKEPHFSLTTEMPPFEALISAVSAGYYIRRTFQTVT